MVCPHCRHCKADPVLRLPEHRPPADPAYDRKLLAAYAAAKERTGQPVRLLVDLNPWLNRARLHEQLKAARARVGSGPAVPEPGVVEKVLRVRTHALLRWPTVQELISWDMADNERDARSLLGKARKLHDASS